MSQTSTTSPRASTSTAPPPYASSDMTSLLSHKSTSKSILAKVFHRKSSVSSSTPSSSQPTMTKQQREAHENEAKHAARASYFATL